MTPNLKFKADPQLDVRSGTISVIKSQSYFKDGSAISATQFTTDCANPDYYKITLVNFNTTEDSLILINNVFTTRSGYLYYTDNINGMDETTYLNKTDAVANYLNSVGYVEESDPTQSQINGVDSIMQFQTNAIASTKFYDDYNWTDLVHETSAFKIYKFWWSANNCISSYDTPLSPISKTVDRFYNKTFFFGRPWVFNYNKGSGRVRRSFLFHPADNKASSFTKSWL